MNVIILTLLLLLVLFWAVGYFWLRGADLSAFDQPTGQVFDQPPGEEFNAVLASLANIARTLADTPRGQHLALLRNYMDSMFPVTNPAIQFIPVNAAGVKAEWVLAPNADSRRRLLYIHGGAYIMGSALSHRRITSKLSEISNSAVLAVDYRLMPEHSRMAGVEDCRNAYRWLLEHGPDGAAGPSAVFVAGDSAGGNLALALLAWIRDQHLRAPNAAVALSPQTDATLGSPSLKTNLATDPMLGPLFKALARVPRTLLLWAGWLQNRVRPCDPLVSPVFGDLSGLPPLLVQGSAVEMLRDDSRRYVNKALAASSPVTLQTWQHMVHVWHIFHPDLPESRQAFDEIGKFLRSRS